MRIALTLLLIACAIAALPAAMGATRPDVTKMTCREATGLVAESGVIHLSTGKHTYGIFAAHSGFCAAGEEAPYAYVRTLDNASCRIGHSCITAVASGGTSIIGTSVGCKEGDRAKARKRDKFVISPEEFVCRGGRWEEVEI